MSASRRADAASHRGARPRLCALSQERRRWFNGALPIQSRGAHVTSTDQEIRDLVAGQTVASEFVRTAGQLADRRALRWMEGDGWGEMTFAELAEQVAR